MAEDRYPMKGGESGRGSRYRRNASGQWPIWIYQWAKANLILLECPHCRNLLKVWLREWVTGVRDTQRHRICPYCDGYSRIPLELLEYKGK